MDLYRTIPFRLEKTSQEKMVDRSRAFLQRLSERRTVRDFSPEPVSRDVIENCIRAAGTAPNGANRQPWHFVAVTDSVVKKKIREEAEKEEKAFYEERAPKEWLEALAHLGTDDKKPFLETAPVLIAIFGKPFDEGHGGKKLKNYYVTESVGIATGMLITALHEAGLSTLTHTPSPMKFLNRILGRPKEERPFLLLVVGRPEKGCRVPDIHRKPLSEIATFL